MRISTACIKSRLLPPASVGLALGEACTHAWRRPRGRLLIGLENFARYSGALIAMLYNIQALRALAATMVIFVHLDVLLQMLGMKSFGSSGVDLFFVISGFIMVMTTRRHNVSSIDFLKNRFSRIVPIYWFMTIVVFVVAVRFPHLLKSTSSNIVELLKSMMFIPFRKESGLVQPVLFVGWTLNYEMFFYLIFSLCLLFKNYIHGIFIVLSFLTALVVLGFCAHYDNVIVNFYTSPIIFEFAIGMIIGIFVDRIPDVVSQTLKYSTALVTAAAIGSLFVVPNLFPDANRILMGGLPAGAVVVCALALEKWNIKLTSAAFISIGNASYVIYLIHPFFTQASQKLATHFRVTPATAVTFIVLCICVIMVAGLAIHNWLEKPLVRWTKTILSTRPDGGKAISLGS